MFLKSKNLLGIDIGTSSVKLVRFEESRRGLELTALAMGSLPSEVVVEGEVMDVAVVIDTIRQLLKDNSIKAKETAASVLNRSVIVKKIKLPKMSTEELEESIHIEAEQYIPFDIEDVNLDFQIIDENPENDENNMEVLLVVVKKEKISDIVNIISGCGLTPEVIDVDSFALENQYELMEEEDEGHSVALIDIGASIANLVIIKNGSSIFSRDMSVGGNSYTKAIQKDFSISFEQAETLKLGEDLEEVSRDNIEPVISKVSEEIANEIQGAFGYFSATFEEESISKIVLSGGCACLPGFAEFMEERLEIPVEVSNPLRSVYFDPNKFDPEFIDSISPMMAVTVGLALRRIGDR